MAAGGSDAYASIRHAGSTAHERGPAGPVVAFCRGDRCVGSRVGMATARGPALMGGALWERLARVFGRSARERSEAERILLEADFGVEATEEILDRVSGAKDGDHDFRSALERAVIGALTPAAPSVAPGALAHAPAPPTVILVFGVNGVGKTTAVAKLGARPGGRHRHGARGYRRAAAHGRAPARGVEKSGARRRQAAAGRAARVVPGARRHGGTERGAPGPRVRGRGAAHRADRDEARRHREGRERGGARARGASPDPLSRHGRGPRRSRGVRRGTVRAEAHRRVTLQLRTSVKYLKGVGPKRAEALARLGIRSVGDLLYHAPHRYLDATTVTPLHKAQVGQEATCVGRVVSTGVLPARKGLRVFRAVLRDDSGGRPLECAWPGQPFLERQIKIGHLPPAT